MRELAFKKIKELFWVSQGFEKQKSWKGIEKYKDK